MTRLRSLLSLVGLLAVVGLGPAYASSQDDPALDDLSTRVRAPFRLTIRNRAWDGNTHAMPSGRAVLERTNGPVIWELGDVTSAVATADGGSVAFLTSDYQVFVSRLPETPRSIEGGPYLGPALSSDGKQLLAQKLGRGDHILDRISNTEGIVLVDLDTGRDRLLLDGNDLFSPSFASDGRVFFGSGKDGIASLYILDTTSMELARITNRVKDARQTFPSEAPSLMGGMVVYRADDENYRVSEPNARDFARAQRFDSPRTVETGKVGPNVVPVRLRTPSTQVNNPPVFWYFDLDQRSPNIMDWACQNKTYNGHQGTDINQSMGFNVVAPASGEIVMRNDGCPDSNSPGCGGGFGNYVRILHSDGSQSVEAHGKKWTVAAYGTYACAAKVMESASSGNSSKPHIHHESWADVRRFDPFQGSCNADRASKWSKQNGYLNLPGSNCTN